MVAKEISRLWNESGFRWKKGAYGPSNTVLIEDDPYSSLKNRASTTILLKTYSVEDPGDNYLGKLRVYLQGLADAKDVREYIKKNTFDKFVEVGLPSRKGLLLKNVEGPDSAPDKRLHMKETQLDKLFGDDTSLEDLLTKALSIKDNTETHSTASTRSYYPELPSSSKFPSRHFLTKTKTTEATKDSVSKIGSSVVTKGSLFADKTSGKSKVFKTEFSDTKQNSDSNVPACITSFQKYFNEVVNYQNPPCRTESRGSRKDRQSCVRFDGNAVTRIQARREKTRNLYSGKKEDSKTITRHLSDSDPELSSESSSIDKESVWGGSEESG